MTNRTTFSGKYIYENGNAGNYIPANTIIHINADGSGDFSDLPSAINYCYHKYSDGTVRIELDEGTHLVPEGCPVYTSDFNFSRLIIQGKGVDKTILKRANYTYRTLEIHQNGCSVLVQKMTIQNTKDGSTYHANSHCILTGGASDVALIDVKCTNFSDCGIIATSGSRIHLGGSISVTEGRTGILAYGGFIDAYAGVTLNAQNLTTMIGTNVSGVVSLNATQGTYSGVTNKYNTPVNAITTNGYICCNL